MASSIQDKISKLPIQRQKRIHAKADAYINEYRSLQELRKALKLTQTDVANKQGVRQVNISNLEKRSDMMLSTLKNYVEALGCELEILVKTPNNKHVKIENLPNS